MQLYNSVVGGRKRWEGWKLRMLKRKAQQAGRRGRMYGKESYRQNQEPGEGDGPIEKQPGGMEIMEMAWNAASSGGVS